MNINAKLLIIAFILAIFSIGAVAAAENFTNNGDLTQVPHEQVVSVAEPTVQEVETIDLDTSDTKDTAVTNKITSGSDDLKSTDSKNESFKMSKKGNVLGASNQENLLSDTIYPTGDYSFAEIRQAINNANDGDIIDLQGNTFYGFGGKIECGKAITIANGKLDGNDYTTSYKFIGCKLENLSVANLHTPGGTLIRDCVLNNVSFDNVVSDSSCDFLVRNSKFESVNFTNCHALMPADPDEEDFESGVMIVSYDTTYNNCYFINCSSNRHSGAICVAGEKGNTANITNCVFDNCTSGVGGAIYLHGTGLTANRHSNIINCTFKNCEATEWGGALGSSQDYLNVENCEFINNSAKQGAAIMVGGITHGLDGDNSEGNYNTFNKCYFHNNTGTEEGGAVHITGDNNNVIKSHFDDNYAHGGNGAAIYVKGQNAYVFDSEFFNHDCDKGTIYIEGNNAKVEDSTFEDNFATFGGAGVYIIGNDATLDGNTYQRNDAVDQGGAVHVEGNHSKILNSFFYYNNAIPDVDDKDQGLGGAIYIKGNHNEISYSQFEGNTARNGSAIYNKGLNLTLNDDYFHNNQAWSYLLFTVIKPNTTSYYNESAHTIVEITHIGGDNIINAIHNAGSVLDIFFHNVTYYHSEGVHKTGAEEIHPVDGVQNSKNATILYQDDREDSQVIDVIVTKDENGEVIFDSRGQDLRSGLFGNLTIVLRQGLRPGNYTVNATHPDDQNYTEITNITHFEILPHVDVSVTKTSDKDIYFVGENAIFTIGVYSVGTNATNVKVKDLLPKSFKLVSAIPTKGTYDRVNNIWDIGSLPHGARETLTLTVQTTELGTFDNVVNVTCTEKDWNLSNNVDNKTIHVDLYYTKEANVTQTSAGEYIEYYLRVFNTGSETYTETVRVHDLMPKGIKFESYELVGADLIDFTDYAIEQIWEITNISAGYRAKITVKAKTLRDGLWNNTMTVWDYPSVNATVNVSSNADLRVIKEVSSEWVNKGDVINWTIQVKNEGPSIAMGAYVTDIIPNGLTIVGFTNPTKGNYNRDANTWTIGDMNVGETETLIITTRVTISAHNITNVATVNSTTPDPNPDNNEDNATTYFNPDVEIKKVVSDRNAYHNEIISWTITVTNNGPNAATGVYVIDKLPDGLRFINSTDNSYNPVSGRWTVGTLEEGESAVLTINTRVTVYEGFISNNATVYATKDNNDENNYAEDFTQVTTEADVGVVKLVSNQTSRHGDEIVWTVVVTNYGPTVAENVVLIDFLPVNDLQQTRQPTVSKGQISHQDVTGRWDIGNMAVGETQRCEVFTKVITTDKTIINTVEVTSDTEDPNPSNNRAENGTYVPPECDMQIIKTVNDHTPAKGSTVIWTIAIVNVGPDAAEDVVVNDVLPDGLEYVSHTPASQGTFNHVSGIWSVGTVEVDARLTLNITTKVVASGNITNEVNVTTSTYDTNLENNYANETIDVPAIADLAIIKVVSNKNPKFNDLINWTIAVTNLGPDTAKNVFVNDMLPEGLVYITHKSNPKGLLYDYVHGIWQIGDLKASQSVSLTITTRVNITNTTITNVAVVNSDTPDNDTSNNEDNDTTSIGPVADLEIIKTVDNHSPNKGDNITWTVVATNKGPDVAINAIARELLPEGLILIRAYPTGQSSYDHRTNTWYLQNMTKGQSISMTLVTQVNVTKKVLTNIIVVTSETPDPDLTNNEDNDTIDVGHEADVGIVKTVSNSTPRRGDNITWTITVTNNGPDDAIEVIVDDILPEGLVWISDNGNGTYNYQTGIWHIGTLTNQSSLTLTIVTRVDISGKNITNVANVTSYTRDPHPENNTDNDTIDVEPEADLLLYKFVNAENSVYNGELVWTIYVINNGPDTAIDAYVNDILPDGLIYVNSNATLGSYDVSTGVWTIGNLTKGSSAYLIINSTVNILKGTITNYAVVNSSTYDPNPDNNNDTAFSEVESVADLQIIKTVSDIKSSFGDNITWTITVTNNGPCDAYNVNVTDSLPDGLIYNGHSTANGNYNSDTGLWTIGELTNGSSVFLEIYAIVNVTNATITNIAVVNSTTPDSNESNNKANNTTYVDPIADLAIIKVTIDTPNTYDGVVIWTIYVTNNGPDAAKDVYVEDVLPDGVSYYSHVNDVGLYDHYKGIWYIGDMENGDFHYLSILTVVEIREGNITNVAVVNSSTPDNNTENNVDNDTVEVIDTNADLEVIKLVSDKTAKYDDLIIWTIQVTNNGPDDAYDVYVDDELPGDLRYISHSADVGLYDPSSGIWLIGDMENGDSFKLIIYTSVIIDEGKITNVAVVNSSTPDNNPENNKANNTTVVNEFNADLEVVKYVSNANTKKGDTIVWTIVITNNGPDVAYDAFVEDKLPEGLTYVSHKLDNGLYDPINGIWYLGDIENGDSFTLSITTIVNIAGGNITNVAVADSTTPDNNPDNNKANNTTNVDKELVADLEVVKIVNDTNPHKGDTIEWSILVVNNGPGDAKDVTVTDKLPAGLKFISADGDYDADTGVWTIGDLANTDYKILVIKTLVEITNANITNVAVVNSTTPDNNTDNNKDNETTEIDPEADVKVVKVVSNPTPTKGDTITWTVIVTNLGPDAAENVVVGEKLPEGLTLVSAKGSKGEYGDDVWTIGTLQNGEIATLTLTTKVTSSSGTITNVVTANSTTYDPNKTNNKDSEKTTPKAPPKDSADLEIIKMADKGIVKVGDEFIWTVTVINHGPSKAVGVYVDEMLDTESYELIAYKVSKGTFSPDDEEWLIGDMEVGERVTLEIKVKALVEGEVENYASVDSETPDPNPDNNDAYALVVVEKDGGNNDDVPHTPKHPSTPKHSTPTMHATGNPIFIVLLALLSIAGVTLRRKD